jgi:glycosyltransferase involved in cell wall biosynthesis
MAPDVSVVIPTFRRPKELHEALASVLRQEGVAVEVIVVDDSPEGSAEAVAKSLRDARVTYLRTDQPTGGKPSTVRNFGWPHARGRFIHFLDDDDRVPQGHYRQALKDFEAHPDQGVMFGLVDPFCDDGRDLTHEREFFQSGARRARFAQRIGTRVLAARQLLEPTMLVCSAGLCRAEVPRRIGGFDENIRMVEDVDFYARAFRACGAFFVDRVVLEYRIGPGLMHSRTNDEEIVQSYKRMHAKYQATYGAAELLALKAMVRGVLRFA